MKLVFCAIGLIVIFIPSVLLEEVRLQKKHDYNVTEIRLEKDYDYKGVGDSYYLKVVVDEEKARFVCADEQWDDFLFWETYATEWCKPMGMTFGSPYTETDYRGEVHLELACGFMQDDIDDCEVKNLTLGQPGKPGVGICSAHVRIQCMEPADTFTKGQPLTGALAVVCGVLVILLLVSWVCCCIVECCRTGSSNKKGVVHPGQGAQQQPASQPLYPPLQQGGAQSSSPQAYKTFPDEPAKK